MSGEGSGASGIVLPTQAVVVLQLDMPGLQVNLATNDAVRDSELWAELVSVHADPDHRCPHGLHLGHAPMGGAAVHIPCATLRRVAYVTVGAFQVIGTPRG